DHADDLATPYIQIEVLVHHVAAELVAQPADADDRLAFRHKSISMKKTAASASIRMTTKIDWTTLEVVWVPTDSALPATLNPSRQPIAAIRNANTGALLMPTQKWRTAVVSCRRVTNISGEMSS